MYRQDRPFLFWIIAEINRFTLAFREVLSQVQFGDSALDLVDGMIWKPSAMNGASLVLLPSDQIFPAFCSQVYPICVISREVSKFSLPNSI